MMFDKSPDELVHSGATDDIEAKVRKARIRERIEILQAFYYGVTKELGW